MPCGSRCTEAAPVGDLRHGSSPTSATATSPDQSQRPAARSAPCRDRPDCRAGTAYPHPCSRHAPSACRGVPRKPNGCPDSARSSWRQVTRSAASRSAGAGSSIPNSRIALQVGNLGGLRGPDPRTVARVPPSLAFQRAPPCLISPLCYRRIIRCKFGGCGVREQETIIHNTGDEPILVEQADGSQMIVRPGEKRQARLLRRGDFANPATPIVV